MAIWQFQIYLIPREVIYDKYGFIPEQLHIDNEKFESYFKESKLDGNSFEDALTILWWLDQGVFTNELFPLIEKFTQIQKTNTGFQDFGTADKNSISVSFNEANNMVEEVSARIDLRNIEKRFIQGIISLAKRFDCLFMDSRGRIFEPTSRDLSNVIQSSDPYRFVSDPEQFLKDLSNKTIKPDQ